MKIAIIHEDGEILVSFDDDTFRKMLKTYLEKENNVDTAMDLIISELKIKTRKL